MKDFHNRIQSLISTSVDDCRITIGNYKKKDIPMLEDLLLRCEAEGHKSRAAVVRRRLNQLKKGSAHAKA